MAITYDRKIDMIAEALFIASGEQGDWQTHLTRAMAQNAATNAVANIELVARFRRMARAADKKSAQIAELKLKIAKGEISADEA